MGSLPGRRLLFAVGGAIFNGMKNGNISIKDVAAACGVSAMTVSRALRQSPLVRPETMAQIVAKAEELGYFKSSRLGRPRREAAGAAHRVRLILGGAGSNVSIFHSRLVNTIQRKLIRHNCECVLYSHDATFSSFFILLAALKRMDADVTVIIGDFPESQLKTLLMEFPGSILLDNPGIEEFDATFSSFNFDNAAAAEMMLRHLLDSGRRKIVLMSGPEGHFFSEAMERAYRALLPGYGIGPDERLMLRADFTAPGAAAEMERFLRRGVPFDAVFSNDEMALGVCRALLNSGRSIPRDAAVAGCDNLPLGQMFCPALSTVDLDYGKLADAAAAFILSGEMPFAPRRVLIPPRLLIRESTVEGRR